MSDGKSLPRKEKLRIKEKPRKERLPREKLSQEKNKESFPSWSKRGSRGVRKDMNFIYNKKELKGVRRKLRRNQTDAERELWKYLRRKQVGGFRFLRQYSVGNFVVDFYCAEKRLAIEIDGGQHAKDTKEKDKTKEEYLKNKNIKIIRFWNVEVFNNIEGVLFKIREELGLDN
ncbi:MAG: endonuclease domain-containing protein [Patescibacteria group bacterium]|nr:endonuclease domain-containing protein [Patescibacteria group bacterium]